MFHSAVYCLFIATLRVLIYHYVDHHFHESAWQGAATTCYVALHPQLKGVSGEYFKNSNLGKATAQANDVDLAKKLWEFSINLTK